jgi:DNA polymerase III subunit chi
MTEVWFFHLERQTLEAMLPQLVEKTLAKGWRAVIKAGSEDRAEAISSALWMHSDDGFIPHGTKQDGRGAEQPVWITAGNDAPNAPQALFLVDGAEATDLAGIERVVRVFDGNAEESVVAARAAWKVAKAEGHDISYWQQDERGRWINKAAKEASA